MEDKTTQTKNDERLQSLGKTVVKLALLSLAVGLFMSFFDITAVKIFENFGDTVKKAYAIMTGWLTWMVPYIMLGATIVIPIWALLALLKLLGKRKSD